MRNILRYAAVGFVLVGLWLPGALADAKKKSDDDTCQFGTKLHFEKTPSDAARKALKEEKLVCILHVSGDFEDPDFT